MRSVLTTGLALLLSGTAHAAVTYEIVDLGDLPGGEDSSYAFALNEAGQIAGSSGGATGQRAFRWTRSGGMQDLGWFDGHEHSRAQGINNAGQVVGLSVGPPTGTRAFIWTEDQGIRPLAGLDADVNSLALGINDAGQVVGRAGNGPVLGYRWTAAAGPELLHATGANSSGLGLNEAGDIVGWSVGSGGPRATVWMKEGGAIRLSELTNDVVQSFAKAINASRQVVGYEVFNGSPIGQTVRAFMWSELGGTQVLAHALGFEAMSLASDVNDEGAVVGYGAPMLQGGAGSTVAVLWRPSGQAVDLNTLIDPALGWTLSNAQAINNRGQIAGNGVINGRNRAFLLTPIGLGAAPVPEPSAWALLMLGFGAAGATLRARASRVRYT